MNKIVTEIITRKTAHAAENAMETAKEAVGNIRKYADEEVIISRKTLSLKVAAAFLGGIVLGMLISPRKKVSYKIASENHDIGGGEVSVNSCCDDDCDEDEYDDDDNDERSEKECCRKKKSKLIKL